MAISKNFRIAKFLRTLKPDQGSNDQTVTMTNDTGVGAVISEFKSTTGSLKVTYPSGGDYFLGTTGDNGDNGFTYFNSGTTGAIGYVDGTARIAITTSGITVTGTAAATSVDTNIYKTNSNAMYFFNDADANSSSDYGFYWITNTSSTANRSEMSLFNNDLSVRDNIYAGRSRDSAGTIYYEGAAGFHAYGYATDISYAFTSSLYAENSTDPEGYTIRCQSRDTYDEAYLGSSRIPNNFLVQRSGLTFSWNGFLAGRMRIGDTGTTTWYRAADHSVSAYSATGGTHGQGTYKGFTQITGRETLNTDDVFAVYSGNDNAGAGGQYVIEFDANGNGYFDGVGDNGNADYAEYFEWEDGNPNNEDRRGLAVVLSNGRFIRPATSTDAADDFLGVVSVAPALVGDSAYFAWKGKWKRDKFGAKIQEDYDVLCWGEYDPSNGGWTNEVHVGTPQEANAPADATRITKQRPVLNEDFDPAVEYMPRENRPEWQAIGLLGKVPLLKGQPTSPRWRKLFDLNEEVEMWLVR
jgi:hypothetical protein